MGMVGAAFGLGFIFGPAIGGVLSRISPETPMWFASALCLANFVAAWFLLPESRSANASTKSLGRMEAFRHAFTKPTLLLLLSLYLHRHAGVLGLRSDVRDLQRGEVRLHRVDDRIRVRVHRRGAGAGAGRARRQGRQGHRRAQADPAGDLGDRGRHRLDSVRVERADAARRAGRAGGRHGLQQPVVDVDGVAAGRSRRSGRHPRPGVVAGEPGPRRRAGVGRISV